MAFVINDRVKETTTTTGTGDITFGGAVQGYETFAAGIGNSILALEDNMIYYYKQNTHFVDGKQFTIKWNSPEWDFWWPIKEPILSMRDERGDYVK